MIKRYLSICLCTCGVLSADLTWTTPGQLTSSPDVYSSVTTTYDPATATLIALWQDNGVYGYVNWSSISTNHGVSWMAAQRMSNDGNGFNNVYGAYTTYSNVQSAIAATYSSSSGEGGNAAFIITSADGGMSWNSSLEIPDTSVSASDVFAIFAAQPSSLLVSFSSSSTPEFIQTSDGSSWSSPQQISTDMVYQDVFISYNPSSGPSGAIVATWLDANYGPPAPVSSNSMDLGTTWNGPTQILTTPTGGGTNVTVSYNSVYNTTIAAWGNGGDNLAQFAVSNDDGDHWPTLVGLSVGVLHDVYTAVDPVTGITMATWTGSDSSPYYSFSQDGGMTWSSALAIGASTVNTDNGNEDVFVSFDPGSRSFIATWANSSDSTPWYALFALPSPPVPPGPMFGGNFGGNAGRLAVYLRSLPSSFTEPLTSLTTDQLKKALIEILPKPTTKLSAANTLLVMGDAMEKRMSRRTPCNDAIEKGMSRRTPCNKKSSLASSLEERGGVLLAQNADFPQASNDKKEYTYAVWEEAFGELSYQHAQDQLPSFRTETGGLLLGFDYHALNGKISTAFSYAQSHVHSSMEEDRINFYALALYGITYIDDGFLEAGIWGVYNQYRQDRHVAFPGFDERARSHFHGWQYAPHLRGGYDIDIGSSWVLEPFVTSDLAIVYQTGYSEHGAGLYDMKQKRTTSQLLQASTGCNAYTGKKKRWGSWALRGSLAYMYKKGFDIGNIRAAIVGQAPGFSVIAYKTAQNLIIPGFEFFCRDNRGLFASVSYEGQFASKYVSNVIFGKVGAFF